MEYREVNREDNGHILHKRNSQIIYNNELFVSSNYMTKGYEKGDKGRVQTAALDYYG